MLSSVWHYHCQICSILVLVSFYTFFFQFFHSNLWWLHSPCRRKQNELFWAVQPPACLLWVRWKTEHVLPPAELQPASQGDRLIHLGVTATRGPSQPLLIDCPCLKADTLAAHCAVMQGMQEGEAIRELRSCCSEPNLITPKLPQGILGTMFNFSKCSTLRKLFLTCVLSCEFLFLFCLFCFVFLFGSFLE